MVPLGQLDQIFARAHGHDEFSFRNFSEQLLVFFPEPRGRSAKLAVHLHGFRRGHVRLAGGGNQERSVRERREEHGKQRAIRIGRLLPESLVDAREMLARLVAERGPVNRRARAVVVDGVINRIKKSQAGQLVGQRLEATRNFRGQIFDDERQGGFGVGIVRGDRVGNAQPFHQPRDDDEGRSGPPQILLMADPRGINFVKGIHALLIAGGIKNRETRRVKRILSVRRSVFKMRIMGANKTKTPTQKT